MIRRPLVSLTAMLFISLLIPVKAGATTYTWISGTTAMGYNPSAWSPNGYPGPGDDLVFNGSANGICVWRNTGMPSVKSVTLDGYTGEFNVDTQPLEVTGDVIVKSGMLRIMSDFTVDGSINMSGGTAMFSPGTVLTVSSSVVVTGGFFDAEELFLYGDMLGPVLSLGTLTMTGGADARIGGGCSWETIIVNKPGATLTCTGSLSIDNALTVNNGRLKVDEGATLSFSGGFIGGSINVGGNGTLDLTGGNKTVYIGSIALNGGTLKADCTGQVLQPWGGGSGLAITIGANSTIDITGLTINDPNASGMHFAGAVTLTNLSGIRFSRTLNTGVCMKFDALAPGRYTFDHCVFKYNGWMGSETTPPAGVQNVQLPSSFTHDGTNCVLMTNVSGSAAGAAYEIDPNGVLFWGAPAAPVSFQGVALSSAAVEWGWTADPDADGYTVNAATSNEVLAQLAPGTTWFRHTGLSANTTDQAYLVAFNPISYSTGTATACVTKANPPLPWPSSLGGFDMLMASWDTNGNSFGTEYFVQFSTDPVGFSNPVSSPWMPANMYPGSGLRSDTTYYYQVKARNFAGVETVFVSTNGARTGFASPGDFAGVVLSTGSIRWTWTDLNSGEAGYNIYSDTGGLIAALPPNATEYVETGLPDNARCTRNVAFIGAAGRIEPSERTLTLHTLVRSPDPSGVAVSSVTPHGARFAWPQGRESGCRIAVSTVSAAGPWSRTRDVARAPSLSIDGLLPASTYFFSIAALNGDGIPSVSSVPVQACTLPAPAMIVDISSAPYAAARDRSAGTVRVDLPQGAVNCEVYIDIQLNPAVDAALIAAANARLSGPNGPRCLAGSLTGFDMYTSSGGHYTGSFGREATLRLPFSDANNDGLVDGLTPPVLVSSLRVYVLNESAGQWEEVPSTVDAASHQVVARIRHFSVYTIFSVPAAMTSLAGVKVYPNPYEPGSGGSQDRAGGIVFDKLTARTNIKVFTVAGELVFEANDDRGTGQYEWPGVNSSGSKLASGVYIYLVTDTATGQKTKGKLAIIR